jgi:hypothetical protein
MSDARARPPFTSPAGEGPAALALEKGNPLFHTENRQEEKGEVMISPFHACLIESARGAHPGVVVKGLGLGLNPGNKEEHKPSGP